MGMLDRILKELDKRSISPSALEKELGFGNASIKRWDRSSPSVDKILKVANYLNISVDYLLTGKAPNMDNYDPDHTYLHFDNISEKIDYINRVLHMKEDTIFIRFRKARKAAGVSVEDAAKGSFLKEEDILTLENDDIPSGEIEARMKWLQEIGLEQYCYLAYKYNVDLYWLLCGKVRPPAAVVQDAKLVFPPYQFMIKDIEQEPEGLVGHQHQLIGEYSERSLRPDEEMLLEYYSSMKSEERRMLILFAESVFKNRDFEPRDGFINVNDA